MLAISLKACYNVIKLIEVSTLDRRKAFINFKILKLESRNQIC